MKLKVSIVESPSFLSPSCSGLKNTRKSSSRLPEVLVNYVYLCMETRLVEMKDYSNTST